MAAKGRDTGVADGSGCKKVKEIRRWIMRRDEEVANGAFAIKSIAGKKLMNQDANEGISGERRRVISTSNERRHKMFARTRLEEKGGGIGGKNK